MKSEEIGKSIIIGINFFDDNKDLVDQYQTNGIIESITKLKIIIRRQDSSIFTLPNDDRAIMKAKPGTYREHSSGKLIEDPHYLAQWAVDNVNDDSSIEYYKKVGFQIDSNK